LIGRNHRSRRRRGAGPGREAWRVRAPPRHHQ